MNRTQPVAFLGVDAAWNEASWVPFSIYFLFKCWGNAQGLKRQRATLQEENTENAGHLCTGDMSFPAYLSPTSPLKSPSALPKEMQPHRGLALVGEKEQLWGPGERTPQAVCGRDPSDPLCTSCRGRAVETECPLYQTAGKVIKTHGLGPLWKPHRHQAEQSARLPRISYLLSSPQRRKVCHWGDTFKRKDIICYFSVLSLSLFFLNSGNGAFLVDKALGAIGERKKNITTNRLLCASTFALFSFHLRYKLTNKSMEW